MLDICVNNRTVLNELSSLADKSLDFAELSVSGSLGSSNLFDIGSLLDNERIFDVDNLNLAHEVSGREGDLEKQPDERCSDSKIDTSLDGDKDCEDNCNEEDDCIDGGNFPEVEELSRMCHQVKHSVNDDGRKNGIGDPVEDSVEGVQSNEHNNTSVNTGKRCSHTTLCLKGRSREGTGGGVGVEEGSNQVGNTNSNELLVGRNLVVVDTAKGLEMAMCSSRRTTVETGSSEAILDM